MTSRPDSHVRRLHYRVGVGIACTPLDAPRVRIDQLPATVDPARVTCKHCRRRAALDEVWGQTA